MHHSIKTALIVGSFDNHIFDNHTAETHHFTKPSPAKVFLKKSLALLLGSALCGAITAQAHADALGVRAGAYRWMADYDGDVKSGGETVDINNDLGFDDDDMDVFFIAIEHPLPVLPNLLLQHTRIDSHASNTLSRTFEFDDEIYFASDTVETALDLSHTDATFYYEILDNWAEVDLGLTARYFEEGVKLRAVVADESSELDINTVIPMVYVAARFNLPLSGLYVAVDGNGIGYSGNTLFDYRAMVGYESKIGLGAELGYRSFDLSYEDDDDQADVKIDGVFAEVFYHF